MRWSALIALPYAAVAGCASAEGASAPAIATAPAQPIASARPTTPAADYRRRGRPARRRLSTRSAPRERPLPHPTRGLAWFTARFDTKAATLDARSRRPERARSSPPALTRQASTQACSTTRANAASIRPIGRALGAGAPQITFTSTAIERTGEHTARMTGDLTHERTDPSGHASTPPSTARPRSIRCAAATWCWAFPRKARSTAPNGA